MRRQPVIHILIPVLHRPSKLFISRLSPLLKVTGTYWSPRNSVNVGIIAATGARESNIHSYFYVTGLDPHQDVSSYC